MHTANKFQLCQDASHTPQYSTWVDAFDASFLDNPREYLHKLYTAETRVTVEDFAADDMCLSLFVFTKLFSNVVRSKAGQTGATELNAK